MESSDVKVQVICVTYNQKDYIKEALDSFLMQKTNFKYEVLVGDDCSTDGTSEIVTEYAQKYPEIIKHIKREQNIGCLANFMDLCERVTAPYAAFCDGDDYWTDENKLQKQFDFMEENEDVNICAHRILLKGKDNNWGLYEWYSKQKDPFITPQRKNVELNKKLTINEIAKEWLQMSSLFIRWNKINYPDWAKEGTIGDMTIEFLHLGNKNLYIFDNIMSVWRQGSGGVFAFSPNKNLHFLNTRLEYIKIINGTIKYFKQYFPETNINKLEDRLWTEIINYTDAIIKTDSWDKLLELKEQYPDIYEKTRNLLSEYKNRLKQLRVLGKKRADLLRKNSVLKIIKPIIGIIYRTKKIFKTVGNIFAKILSFSAYWIFALVPKKKNLWVFSGFQRKNYMDNTKYLYEYIVKNHPEIQAVWLTGSKEIRKNLKENKMPVLKMNRLKGILTMARASVAFSDHFRMSDYKNICGFNARTKFVNLWHGVGLKSMIPEGDILPNTAVPGVRLSSDIIINKKDNLILKLIKCFKYVFIAPFRELVEKYFFIICPGQPFIDIVPAVWNIPQKAWLLSGYPRNTQLYTEEKTKEKPYKILYAPTYRWESNVEKNMINNFINNVDAINNLLNKINGEFVIRLHPHTWRNYQSMILDAIKKYPNFSIDKEKDIYKELVNYSLLITDYSSIGTDFLITQNPIIYLAFDYETYPNTDCPFNMPYKENCAGPITMDWQETINEISESYYNPQKYSELRKIILNKFLPKEYNDENNSNRIVVEIEKRLNIPVNNEK